MFEMALTVASDRKLILETIRELMVNSQPVQQDGKAEAK